MLAVDLGTSGPKCAIVSMQGEVLDSDFRENQLLLYDNGGAEQDPHEWWQTILTACKTVLQRTSVNTDDIVAVACTTQWSGTVAVDPQGQPLMNAVIWMDSRGSRYVDQVTGGLIKVEGYGIFRLLKWLKLTGGVPTRSGKDSLAHILYIKNELPEIYAQTHKFLEPKDYINLCFTGRFAASYDSITLYWVTDNRDINNIVYSPSLCKMAGIDREKLPELKKSVDLLGPIKQEVAAELGLRPDVQVVMGTPDLHSAAIGSGAVRDYETHFYIGTSSWLTCHVPFKKTDLAHNMGSIPSAIPGRYFIGNEQETAGACLTFLRDNILYHKDELLAEEQVPDVYKIFDRMVARVPAGCDKLIFTPWLYGERTPVEDHSVRAALYNMSLKTTREHMVRAVFEGVAFNGRWLLKYVERFTKRTVDCVSIIGGGANSDIWCQINADIFDRQVKQIEDPIQANLRGVALIALVALDYMTFEQIADVVKVKHTYSPQPENRAIYDELFREFQNIYDANKKIYRRLNRKH